MAKSSKKGVGRPAVSGRIVVRAGSGSRIRILTGGSSTEALRREASYHKKVLGAEVVDKIAAASRAAKREPRMIPKADASTLTLGSLAARSGL
jgi:hypothetical protein